MATTNRVYILAAFFFSAIGVVFNIVSIGTENWINGEAIWVNDTGGAPNSVNYGLFQGNYKRSLPFSTIYQLTMTCNFKINICALLCGANAGARATLLEDLYNNNIAEDYNAYGDCPKVLRRTYYLKSFEDKEVRADPNNDVTHDSFLNAGVWLSTLIFLILSTLIGLFASVLALYNTVTNPIQYFLSVRSLFYYNGAAFCCTILYLVLWGTIYNITIFHNVGIFDTLVHNIDSDKRVFLGYSYWISFISLTFYCGSIAILYFREYLNARDPKQQHVNLEVNTTDQSLFSF